MAALALAGAAAGIGVSRPAVAVVDPENPCNVTGWFVNPDEADRAPARSLAGFTFEGADLIHHDAPAGLTTAALSSGDFTASPAPDQPSFFSVEVSGDDGGYGTLRYARLTPLWTRVSGGQLEENADPDKPVDMPPVKRSHKVVRFGVGYTKSPPGTVATTVSSVSFQGKAYTLSCPKAVDPSPTSSASTSPTATASPTTTTSPSQGSSATPTSTVSPASGSSSSASPRVSTSSTSFQPIPGAAGDPDDSLPVTGSSLIGLISGAVFLVAVGGIAVIVARKRRRA